MKNLIFCTFLVLLSYSCQETQEHSVTERAPYTEAHRPQFHFSPESGWMNDPNGMVYFEGEYHLFYQYYPYASIWGPMHWGHAVSKDLQHWEHLPIALYPDEHGMIFSGSAVIDWKNTSGFGDGKTPPMIAIYTYHNMLGERSGKADFQTQGIAYSLDKGRTWTKYDKNPVIRNPGIRDFRDPKVSWHEPTQKWVMILAAKNRVQIYNSTDLKQWSFASEFGKDSAPQLGVWECPDLFPLAIEGSDQQKWVMIVSHGGGGPNGGSCTRYFVGDFDGSTFSSDYPVEQVNWLDYGKDNYAGVSWSDIPAADGRRLFLGWMSNWEYATKVPTSKWRSAMTIPRELSLKNTPNGLQLFSNPAKEMAGLRKEAIDISESKVTGHTLIKEINAGSFEVELTFDLAQSDSKSFGIEFGNANGEHIRIGYDKASSFMIVDRSNAGKMDFSPAFPGLHYIPFTPTEGEMKWQIFLDHSSMELFLNDGAIAFTTIFFPTTNFDQVHLFAFDGMATLSNGLMHELKGIW
ncbi:MAG: glycoside hydrolase family 32 protein [Saprospiraceae bacterium]